MLDMIVVDVYHKVMVDPQEVRHPKSRLHSLEVILFEEDEGYSVALVEWDEPGSYALAMRWNGKKNDPHDKGVPTSRGYPTWFVVPNWFNAAILRELETHPKVDRAALEWARRKLGLGTTQG